MRPAEQRILDDIARHLDERTEVMNEQETKKLQEIAERAKRQKAIQRGEVVEDRTGETPQPVCDQSGPDPLGEEFAAMRACWEAVSGLSDSAARARVADWLTVKVIGYNLEEAERKCREHAEKVLSGEDPCPHQ